MKVSEDAEESARQLGNPRDAAPKAAVLMEALPYIRQWAGKTMVIKVGGEILDDESILDAFATDVTLMRLVGMNPIVVHGGGPQISEVMARFGKQASFIEGQRITDEETMQIVKMVLIGQINKGIVTAINQHGCRAVGISGEDGQLLEARKYPGPGGDQLGFVGEVNKVNPQILNSLVADEFVPVVGPIGVGPDGSYNINADLAAGAIARELGAEKIIFLTNIEGLYGDFANDEHPMSRVTVEELSLLLEGESISAGMIPKISSVIGAVSAGVPRAHILDGRVRHALLVEILTDNGSGTMVTP
ncbi:MAG: acetylglutamate kinase [Actinomycetota bacterium]